MLEEFANQHSVKVIKKRKAPSNNTEADVAKKVI